MSMVERKIGLKRRINPVFYIHLPFISALAGENGIPSPCEGISRLLRRTTVHNANIFGPDTVGSDCHECSAGRVSTSPWREEREGREEKEGMPLREDKTGEEAAGTSPASSSHWWWWTVTLLVALSCRRNQNVSTSYSKDQWPEQPRGKQSVVGMFLLWLPQCWWAMSELCDLGCIHSGWGFLQETNPACHRMGKQDISDNMIVSRRKATTSTEYKCTNISSKERTSRVNVIISSQTSDSEASLCIETPDRIVRKRKSTLTFQCHWNISVGPTTWSSFFFFFKEPKWTSLLQIYLNVNNSSKRDQNNCERSNSP